METNLRLGFSTSTQPASGSFYVRERNELNNMWSISFV